MMGSDVGSMILVMYWLVIVPELITSGVGVSECGLCVCEATWGLEQGYL